MGFATAMVATSVLAIAAPGRSAIAATNPCALGGTAPVVTSPVDPGVPAVTNNANFDCMMWQEFILLNWPAKNGQPGVPDPTQPLGTPVPTVWETFEGVDQVFPANGQKPAARPFAALVRGAAPERAARIESGALRLLSQTSKISPVLLRAHAANRNTVAEFLSAAGTSTPLNSNTQADGTVLIDQNGQYVYYEEALSPTEVTYIETYGLYESGQQNTYAKSTPIALPAGSVEVKAAWKVLGAGDTPSHFITTQALLNGGSTPVTVGLVGLHIMKRVPDLQQGVWATFVQTENAPLNNGTAGHYSFNNPGCAPAQCPVNTETSAPTPTQVTQVFPVEPASAAPVNAYVAALIPTVPMASAFAYYAMLDTQWPRSSTPLPSAPQNTPLPNGTPNTTTMMNPVLETFLQQTGINCLSSLCHASATTATPPAGVPGPFAAGFSFLLSHAQPAKQ
jgi:hypothetical protein